LAKTGGASPRLETKLRIAAEGRLAGGGRRVLPFSEPSHAPQIAGKVGRSAEALCQP
jgi:hypothetical protein